MNTKTVMTVMDKVRAFMEKNGFPVGDALADPGGADLPAHALIETASVLAGEAKLFERGTVGGHTTEEDSRLMRAHLMLEELSEVLKALAYCDRQDLLDGLADLMYVVVGCAVKYDLPLLEAFDEVHRSNMTKTRNCNDPRLRHKGESYVPPDLKSVLAKHDAERNARNAI